MATRSAQIGNQARMISKRVDGAHQVHPVLAANAMVWGCRGRCGDGHLTKLERTKALG
jgi:hypothetical protein